MVGRDLAGAVSFAASLPGRHEAHWRRAVGHDFMRLAAGGELSPERFDVWVQQDRRFVQGLTRFLGGLIDRAPDEDREGLRSGLAALDPELALFEEHARARGLDLNVAPSPVGREYLRFLNARLDEGYVEALTAYYGCELAYLHAWTAVAERSDPAGPYARWIDNWTSEPFRAYVDWLGSRLDAVAIGLSDPAREALSQIFAETVRLEIAFWDDCLRAG